MKLKSLGLASLLLAMLVFLAFRVVSPQQMSLSASSSSLTVHAPILIDGDANFTAPNGVTGGSGTCCNPYVIEGWDINASTAHGIEIRNTRAHFIVRNVTVHDGANNYEGIRLENITNGRVENVMATNNRYGIYLENSTRCSIFGNNASSNLHCGIVLSPDNHHITVSNNIALYNKLAPAAGGGIEVQGSSNVIVSRNIASYCSASDAAGIWISGGSNNVTVLGNYVSHNRRGIYVAWVSTNVNVTCNVVVDNSWVGIFTHEPREHNDTFYNNYLQNNGQHTYDNGGSAWNISKTLGENILGGPYLGGNYYSDYTGTDADGDGIGDTT